MKRTMYPLVGTSIFWSFTLLRAMFREAAGQAAGNVQAPCAIDRN